MLIFIGVKMLIVDFYKIPVALSLGVVAALIASAMVFSLLIKPKAKKAAVGEEYLLKDGIVPLPQPALRRQAACITMSMLKTPIKDES